MKIKIKNDHFQWACNGNRAEDKNSFFTEDENRRFLQNIQGRYSSPGKFV